MRRLATWLSILLLAAAFPQLALSQQIQTIRIAKGETKDVWFGVNVAGKLHLAVRTRDGRDRVNLWWITWGVGSTTPLDNWGPSGDLDIPITWWKGILSAKLRGTAAEDTVIYLSEKSAIDKTVAFNW